MFKTGLCLLNGHQEEHIDTLIPTELFIVCIVYAYKKHIFHIHVYIPTYFNYYVVTRNDLQKFRDKSKMIGSISNQKALKSLSIISLGK